MKLLWAKKDKIYKKFTSKKYVNNHNDKCKLMKKRLKNQNIL